MMRTRPSGYFGDCQASKHVHDVILLIELLTEDDSLPGVRLKVPLMIVLDSLKHDDSSLRRVGETWMRCNLRSYIR